MAVTPDIAALQSKWLARYGPAPSLGDQVCRRKRINGIESSEWSQHAYGNAWDIGIVGGAQTPYVSWLRSQPEAGLVLWSQNRPADHSDHIHVEGRTPRTGTPDCAKPGGTVTETPKGGSGKTTVRIGNAFYQGPEVEVDPSRSGGGGVGLLGKVGQTSAGLLLVLVGIGLIAYTEVGAARLLKGAKGLVASGNP